MFCVGFKVLKFNFSLL